MRYTAPDGVVHSTQFTASSIGTEVLSANGGPSSVSSALSAYRASVVAGSVYKSSINQALASVSLTFDPSQLLTGTGTVTKVLTSLPTAVQSFYRSVRTAGQAISSSVEASVISSVSAASVANRSISVVSSLSSAAQASLVSKAGLAPTTSSTATNLIPSQISLVSEATTGLDRLLTLEVFVLCFLGCVVLLL